MVLLGHGEGRPWTPERWHKLEQELTQICQEEREQAEEYGRIEANDESPHYTLYVPSTR